jgi:hypothetical protein
MVPMKNSDSFPNFGQYARGRPAPDAAEIGAVPAEPAARSRWWRQSWPPPSAAWIAGAPGSPA